MKSSKQNSQVKNNNLETNIFEKILLFSSGVNLNVLKHCPGEVNKFCSIGATIILTALLAALSGGYAFNFVFDNKYISIIFGLFWGIIIFNLDRYIVMSIKKSNSEKISKIISEKDETKRKAMISDKISSSFGTFLMALPRIIIAIIIALTVSKPIELRLFNKTIEKELSNIANTDISQFETKYKKEIDDLNESINKLNKKEELEKENVYSKNPIYQKKIISIKKNNSDIIKNKSKIKSNEKIIRENRYLKKGYKNITKYYSDGTPYNEIEEYKYWSLKQIAIQKKKENKFLKKENTKINKEKSELKSELKDIEQQFKNDVKDIKDNYIKLRTPVEQQIKIKQENYPEELRIWKSKTEKSTDLLSRLEALGNITGVRESDGSRNSAYWSSLLITLLFISLETAPVIVKLLTKRGPYDELIDRIEYEYFISQQEVISKINSKVNIMLEQIKESTKLEGEIFLKVEKQKLDTELKTNESILNDIAEKQAHLAKLSIEKWYDDELKKLH